MNVRIAPHATHTAVLVLVPAAEPVVGPWRDEMDPSARQGVPAHVTVLFPFVPARDVDDSVVETLRGAVRDVAPFSFRLDAVSWFGDDVVWLVDRGVLVLDARRSNVYAEGHIAGARSFSVWEADLNEKLLALSNEGRPADVPIVVYCSGGDCEDSHLLSEKLFSLGFTNVLVYKDGWPDWQKRGGASRKGGEP